MADAIMIRRPKICLSTGTHTYNSPTYSFSSGHSKCTGSTTCTQCNKRLTETATGKYRKNADATCTTGTKYDYRYTWTNSDIFTKSACPDYHYEDDALGHNPISDNNGVSATCTTSGKTSSYSCSRCGTVTTASSTISALGHNPGSWTTSTSATCTESGTQIKRCTRCNTQVDSQTIDALGHNPISGGTAGVHTKCSRCGVTISSQHTSFQRLPYWLCDSNKFQMHSLCECGYSYTDECGAVEVDDFEATCLTPGYYHHCAMWNNREFSCGERIHERDINPDNHEGSPVNGGTKDCHTKYSCCDKIISSEHNYEISCYADVQWNDDCSVCTSYYACDCGYLEPNDETLYVELATIRAATCVTPELYRHGLDDGFWWYCEKEHVGAVDPNNHEQLTTTNISDGLNGHKLKKTCASCGYTSTGSLNSHSYSNLSSVSSTRHIGKCSVCGYAAYQEHYAANKPKFTAVAVGETWLCEGCNYDTGKSVLSTGSSTSGFTSPFSYIFPPSWTN